MTPLETYVKRWQDGCGGSLCPHAQNVCLFRGTAIPCPLVFVGESPGASENALGVPFTGPAGQLLDRIIAGAVPAEVDYAMTNLTGCMAIDASTGSKAGAPLPEHVTQCSQRLREFVALCAPRLIVAVGTQARDCLDPKMAGSVWELDDPDGPRYRRRLERRKSPLCEIPQLFIYHPSYMLKSLNAMQRDLAVQKATVQLRNAVEKYVLQIEEV